MEISQRIAEDIEQEFQKRHEVSFAEIHDAVELHLMDESKQAAKAYILYRRDREKARGGRDNLMEAISQITKEASKDNANIHNSPASKIYQMASEISKYYTLKYVMPKEMAKAHESGDLHIINVA